MRAGHELEEGRRRGRRPFFMTAHRSVICVDSPTMVVRRGWRRECPVAPEDQELAQGLKLAAIAVVCAVLAAVLVIGVGEALLRRFQPTAFVTPLLVQTAG